MERILDDVSFDADERVERKLTIDGAYVRAQLDPFMKDEDLSRYIL
jgi:ATP-dependent HslUV protease ATP-binding subunit HslU